VFERRLQHHGTEAHAFRTYELQRNQEAYLDALGAERNSRGRVPRGTSVRRFEAADIEALMDAVNEVRLGVGSSKPAAFFERAVIDARRDAGAPLGPVQGGDGHLVQGPVGLPSAAGVARPTQASHCTCVKSQRPTGRRTRGRPNDSTKASPCAAARASRRSFAEGTLDFTQTGNWTVGTPRASSSSSASYSMPNLVKIAQELPKTAWKRLIRPPKYEVATQERARPRT